MKFEDYFKEAITYGESLGLVEDTSCHDFVELDFKKGVKRYPLIYAMKDRGITVNSPTDYVDHPALLNHFKLEKMYIAAYEQYLADKKEPAAVGSAG